VPLVVLLGARLAPACRDPSPGLAVAIAVLAGEMVGEEQSLRRVQPATTSVARLRSSCSAWSLR
jgi:hypothetical protein